MCSSRTCAGIVHVVPETEGHLQPKVLAAATPAAAAGGLRIGDDGVVEEIDNFSGTFQFGPEILGQVREALVRQGGIVSDNAETHSRIEAAMNLITITAKHRSDSTCRITLTVGFVTD